MIFNLRSLAVLVVLATVCVPSHTTAADESCDGCRGLGLDRCDTAACGKVCRPVERTKPVSCVVWEVVYKDICLAGSSRGCEGTCGKVRTVKRLVRRTITKNVPVTEWVVGPGCSCDAGHEELEVPIQASNVYESPLRDRYNQSGKQQQRPLEPTPKVVPVVHLSAEQTAPSGRITLRSLFAK